jgi:hypothetical protein
MTTTSQSTNSTQRLSASLASLECLPPAYVDEITQIIAQYVAEIWKDKAEELAKQEIAKLQSGISHVTRIDTSVTPDGYENRVIGYGEEFTITHPVVTTVENLLQTAISVSRDTTCTQHFDAAYDAMQANNFAEVLSLLAPVINYGVRPGSIHKNPDTVIAQAAYMLLLIGREINNPQSAEEAGLCH